MKVKKSFSVLSTFLVHERSLEIDFLLILLKLLVTSRRDLKVILMSASVNAGLFSEYFNRSKIITIPGFLFPVKEHYLEDLRASLSKSSEFSDDKKKDAIDHDRICDLICDLSSDNLGGSILVFLPGMQDILNLQEKLKYGIDSKNMSVLPLHSSLPSADQHKVFERPPKGITKVILSTNIAETSVTIDDVVVVIDSGKSNQVIIIVEISVIDLF